MAFIKVPKLCRNVCQPTFAEISALRSAGFICALNSDPGQYGWIPALCGLAKIQSPGSLYGASILHLKSISAISGFMGIDLRETSVLQGVTTWRETERVTFNSSCSKLTSCHFSPSSSPTRLMEDFYYAGGVPVVLRELGEAGILHRDAITANGHTIWENVAQAECWNREVIRPFAQPLKASAGIAVLRGNIAPNGAVIKPSAASEHLLLHRGRAVVFESIEELHARVPDESLDIDENCMMVLKNCGPCGYPGMAEVGNMPIPTKLLRRGVREIVRISDARMSGTAYGTVVLHISPEAAIGGPLALVESGDMISLDVSGRSLHLEVEDSVLQQRRRKWVPPPRPKRGWANVRGSCPPGT